jgi:ubiquinol-cytochrome c reductase cytochrome b subunit
VIPNPFWGGALFPMVVLGVLALTPFVERRITGDRGFHNVLDRPRDAPGRTAFGAAFLSWVLLVFFAGSADRALVFLDLSYVAQIWVYRGLVVVAPFVVYFVIRRVCRELQLADRTEEERERAEAEAQAV